MPQLLLTGSRETTGYLLLVTNPIAVPGTAMGVMSTAESIVVMVIRSPDELPSVD